MFNIIVFIHVANVLQLFHTTKHFVLKNVNMIDLFYRTNKDRRTRRS